MQSEFDNKQGGEVGIDAVEEGLQGRTSATVKAPHESRWSSVWRHVKWTLIIFYALSIVAFGGLLTLLIAGATDQSLPDKWYRDYVIEIVSQIINALFCVTGLGLIPWRFRDLYHVATENPRIFDSHNYTTKISCLRWIVILYAANSIFQIGCALCMWLCRPDGRPKWLVSTFVALALTTAGTAGIMQIILFRPEKRELIS